MSRLRQLWAAPVITEDEIKTRRGGVLKTFLLSVMGILLLDILVATPFLYSETLLNLLAGVLMMVVAVICFWLMMKGKLLSASILFVSALWSFFTFYLLFSNGLRGVMAVFCVTGTVIAGLLLGRRAAIAYGLAYSLVWIWLLVQEWTGHPLSILIPVTPVASWGDLLVALWVATVVIVLVFSSLNQAQTRPQHGLHESRETAEKGAYQRERMRALYGIGQAILSSMDLGMILNLLVREVVEQLHVDAAAVLLMDEPSNRLEYAAGEGFHTMALRHTRLEIGSGLAGQAAGELKTVHIGDLNKLENPTLKEAIRGEAFVTYYGVPLVAKEELQGVLEIFHREELASDPEWLAVLETLAAQAAISIHNASLLETTQQSLKETNTLYRISQSLAGSLDPDQLMTDVVELLKKDFGFYHVQIYRMNSTGNALVASHGSGEAGKKMREMDFRLPVGVGIVGQVAETGEAFTTNNVEDVIFFARNPYLPDTQSEMAVPIMIDDQVLGVLDIQQTAPKQLTERVMHLMEAVTDQLSVALQKATLYGKLQSSLRKEKSMRNQLIQSERLALVGRLLASVAHEMNNPIQAIQNALFLIKEDEPLTEQGKQDLELVLSETRRMAALLERLRATYRPTSSEDFQIVQLNGVVDYVQVLTATQMRHSGIEFVFQPDTKLPDILGVPEQLQQVVLNLFVNAIEAMPKGGRLTVKTEKVRRMNQVLITFSDTGSGINPLILPHVFEPFITSKNKGTGLGLTITYDIIQQHAGEIQAENNPEGGAIFKVWLPATRRKRQA